MVKSPAPPCRSDDEARPCRAPSPPCRRRHMIASRKTLSLDAMLALRADARAAGRTVVHCHGCFDIVHPGHIQHLQHARSLGDLLVVSVSADTHVNKGADR